MMTMRRFTLEPLNTTARRAVDDLFDSVFDTVVAGTNTGRAMNAQANGVFTPPLNLWEDESAFFVECELPGFELSDIEITAIENRMTLSGQRRLVPANLPENASVIRRERSGERFSRTIELPRPIDFDQAEAKFEHGVLRVTLPKTQEAKPRRIEVRHS